MRMLIVSQHSPVLWWPGYLPVFLVETAQMYMLNSDYSERVIFMWPTCRKDRLRVMEETSFIVTLRHASASMCVTKAILDNARSKYYMKPWEN